MQFRFIPALLVFLGSYFPLALILASCIILRGSYKPALQELDAVAEYIALDNPLVASDLVKEVFDKTKRLENFPKSGRTPPELPDSVYREAVVPPCRIFYREDGQRVFVLYVMREERQLRAYMLENS